MAELKDHTNKKYWIAHNESDIVHYGEVEVGQVVTTGQPTLEEFDDRDLWKARLAEFSIDPDAEEE